MLSFCSNCENLKSVLHSQVGIRSITKEGREQGKRFGVEQYEMRTFSRDRQFLENLVSLSFSLSIIASFDNIICFIRRISFDLV